MQKLKLLIFTIVLECFHLVSLFKIRRRLIQENKLRQQNIWLSPFSWKRINKLHKHIKTEKMALKNLTEKLHLYKLHFKIE